MRLQPSLNLLQVFVPRAEPCSKFFGADPCDGKTPNRACAYRGGSFQGLPSIRRGSQLHDHTASRKKSETAPESFTGARQKGCTVPLSLTSRVSSNFV